MEKIVITKEMVKPLYESKYIKLYDLQYAEGKHYLNATRRTVENMVAVKTDEEFKTMLPDAVSCCVIVKEKGKEPKLLLTQEYRYPAGQFLLSPPAGLIDPEDAMEENPLIVTAKREIQEETGLTVKDTDEVHVVNPVLFSSPGMTDETNGIVCAVIELEDLSELDQTGAVGTEVFDGFELVSEDEAREIIKKGTDSEDKYFSVYTFMILMYFISGLWK